MKTSVGSHVKVSPVILLSEMCKVQGMMGKKTVEVLRNTGCSGVIISKELEPNNAYTGRSQIVVMVVLYRK